VAKLLIANQPHIYFSGHTRKSEALPTSEQAGVITSHFGGALLFATLIYIFTHY
jgi:hypothetical protein